MKILPNNVSIYTENDTTLNTLEPSFIRKNQKKIQGLSDAVRMHKKPNDTEANLAAFMENNKTEWAFKLLNNADKFDFDVPDYIVNAINWIKE